MNNDEFLRRLSELADWHRPMCGPNGMEGVRRGYDYSKKRNDTLPIEIIRLRPNYKSCEDCGLICERKIKYQLYETPRPHWRERCDCGRYRDPDSGKFVELSKHEVRKTFRNKD